jgi:hypothetical protein
MEIIERFDSFAAAFETAFQDDDWSMLREHFVEDATYLNVGGPDPRVIGRDAIVEFLKQDVANTDRRFDSRTLVAHTAPTVEGDRLSRQWRCTYTLAGTPDLVVEGEARYRFDGDLIQEIEQEPTAASMQNLIGWMNSFGEKLAED